MVTPLSEDFVLTTQDGDSLSLARTLPETQGTVVLPFRGHW